MRFSLHFFLLLAFIAPSFAWANPAVHEEQKSSGPLIAPRKNEPIQLNLQPTDAKEQYILGQNYDHGNGVPKDQTEAIKWYRKAADQGYADAQAAIGISYVWGLGVPQDPAKSTTWFRKAADQNNSAAQRELGHRYLNGEGVPQDPVEAVKWFRKAAEQVDFNAMFFMAICYERGLGVPQDKVAAYRWHLLVVGPDNPDSVKFYARQLTDDQIAEAQRLGFEWRRSHRRYYGHK